LRSGRNEILCSGATLAHQAVDPFVIRRPAAPLEFRRHASPAVAGKLQHDPLQGIPQGQVRIWSGHCSQQLQWILQALADRKPSRVVNALGIPLLTPRQEQIVRMVVEGLPNSEISATLHVSAHTVRNHLYRIYEKLGVSSRVELILYALSRQDLPPTPTSKTAGAAGLPLPKP